jgi:hypothetical protein
VIKLAHLFLVVKRISLIYSRKVDLRHDFLFKLHLVNNVKKIFKRKLHRFGQTLESRNLLRVRLSILTVSTASNHLVDEKSKLLLQNFLRQLQLIHGTVAGVRETWRRIYLIQKGYRNHLACLVTRGIIMQDYIWNVVLSKISVKLIKGKKQNPLFRTLVTKVNTISPNIKKRVL